MPLSRKKHLKAAREALLEKKPTLAEDSDEDVDLNSLKSSLHEATQQIQLLEQQVADQMKVCNGLQDNLNASQDLVNMLRTEISSLKAKNSNINHQLRMERQRYKRMSLKKDSMISQIAFLEKANDTSSKVLKDLQKELSQIVF